MSARDRALAELRRWYDELPRPRTSSDLPARGSIAISLVLLERLKTNFDLNVGGHLAGGRAQIQGASGTAIQRILAAFGETRPFVSEGGRTNRGTPAVAGALLAAIQAARLNNLSDEARAAVLHECQAFLVDKVRVFHSQERIKPDFDPAASTRQFVSDLLARAEETGKRGPVAQYLVGAKLALRFPDAELRNDVYAAADDPSGAPGDFVVGDVAFHVTVAPTQGHFDKCARNLREGRRVFLLVPDAMLVGARQLAELAAAGRIAVESIESFVGQNIEELSGFATSQLADGLCRLLETYNARVDEIENDKSMMVEIPHNLAQHGGRA